MYQTRRFTVALFCAFMLALFLGPGRVASGTNTASVFKLMKEEEKEEKKKITSKKKSDGKRHKSFSKNGRKKRPLRGKGKRVKRDKPANGKTKTKKVLLPRISKLIEVVYELQGGVALYEGDIEIDPDYQEPPVGTFTSYDEKGKRFSTRAGKVGASVQKLTARKAPDFLWPGGIVPFRIHANINSNLRGTIQNAVAVFNANTNLTWRSANNNDGSFVEFFQISATGGGGSSRIGRNGGRQRIRLGGGASQGTVLHEMGHAIGLYHEHTRMDRDEFVDIRWGNIQNGVKHNFRKRPTKEIDIGPYDINSIMHYRSNAFGRNGSTTIVSRVGGTVGRGSTFSSLDIAGIDQLYPDLSSVPTLCIDRNLGRPRAFAASATNLSRLELNNKISSVSVPSGWTVTLHGKENFNGRDFPIAGGTTIHDLRNTVRGNWNNRASSVTISGPPFAANVPPPDVLFSTDPVAFEHDFFRGRILRITGDIPRLKGKPYKFNDKLSSIFVPSGITVTMRGKADYRGATCVIQGPMIIPDLRTCPDGNNWNDRASSIKVDR